MKKSELPENVIAIRDAMAAARKEASENEPRPDFGAGKTPLPHGFRYAADGSIERIVSTGSDGEQNWGQLCSPIEFLATTADADGKSWGVLIRVKDDSGRWHELALPRSSLVGGEEVLRQLLDIGLRFVPVGKDAIELKRLLASVVVDNRARCVPHVGWNDDVFVLPDEIIGAPAENVVFQPPYVINHAYRVGGTFDGWKKEVAGRASGNSRLIFALCNAFSGPLLRFDGMSGGGVHLRGRSSTGKTTALHVAGSVWGGGGLNGFVRSWRATDNALEGVALVHCDTLLPLDEIAEVDPRAAFRSAYMLANGSGKARSNKTGELRASHEWRTAFISTGEIALASKVAEDGRRTTAGQEVRVIDISADAGAGMGMFEYLHGFNRASDFAETLKDAANRHYGHAGREFLHEIVNDIQGVASTVRAYTQDLVAKLCPPTADGQVRRVARRFALIACAGEIATHYEIVPWEPGTAYKAAESCFEDWIKNRGGIGPLEAQGALDVVTGFLHRHLARFQRWGGDQQIIFDRAGYVRDSEDERQFLVFREVFRRDICGKAGVDADDAADILHERGMLEKSSDGKRTRQIRLPDSTFERMYVIKLRREQEAGD
jgi:putative DNA primase/helicase